MKKQFFIKSAIITAGALITGAVAYLVIKHHNKSFETREENEINIGGYGCTKSCLDEIIEEDDLGDYDQETGKNYVNASHVLKSIISRNNDDDYDNF